MLVQAPAQYPTPVILRPSPFKLETHQYMAMPGQSIYDILKSIPNLPPEIWTHGVVHIGEYEITRENWKRVRPKPGTQHLVKIGVRMQGGGGGGGKNLITTLLAVALIVVTTAITGGAAAGLIPGLFAAGSTSASLLAAGVAVVGALALSALAPAPTTPKAGETTDRDAGDLGSAAIQGNTLAPFDPIPFVMGNHRVSPPHLIAPWTEAINDDQYVNAILGLSGPHLLENIRVNDTPITLIENVEIETRDVINDDSDLTIITRQVFENPVGIDLTAHKVRDDNTKILQSETDPSESYSVLHSVTTRVSPDEVALTFAWTGLVFQADTGTEPAGIPFLIYIRRRGDTDWILLPEMHAIRERLEPFRGTIKLRWEAATTELIPLGQNVKFPPWAHAFYSTPSINFEGHTVHSYFNPGSGVFAAKVGSEEGVAVIYLDPAIFPKGQYDITMKRGIGYRANDFNPSTYTMGILSGIPFLFTYDVQVSIPPVYELRYTQSKIPCKVALASVSSIWNEYPLGEKGLSLIAIRAKNLSINNVTVDATGYAPIWDGENWNRVEPTSNPAAWLRAIGLGAQSIRAPFIEQQLDNDSLVDFYDYCGDERFPATTFASITAARGAGLTGASDSKLFTFSAWVYCETSTDARILSGNTTLGGGGATSRFRIVLASQVLRIIANNAAGTVILDASAPALPLGRWVHILISMDMSDTAKRHVYIDGEAPTMIWATYTNDTIDFTLADWGLGCNPDGTGKLNGGLAAMWFQPGFYADFSDELNRYKFISRHKRPALLHVEDAPGTKPFGFVPLVMFDSIRVPNRGDFREYSIGTGGVFNASVSSHLVTVDEPMAATIRQCNAFIDGNQSVGDVMRLAAACGRASVRVSDKIGVIIDDARENELPIQLFSQRNTRGLTIERAFPKVPYGLRVRYNNRDNDYRPEELFVYRADPASTGDVEAIDYIGLTSEQEARSRAYHDLMQLTRRATMYAFDTDIESLYCTRGSLVALVHDTLRRHYDAARIISVQTSGSDVTGVTVDAPLRFDLIGDAIGVEFDGSTQYLRRAAGLTGASDGKELTFSLWLNPTPHDNVGGIDSFTKVLMNFNNSGGNDEYTKILLHFDSLINFNIPDVNYGNGPHIFTAFGNRAFSTSTRKFGISSFSFDGATDIYTSNITELHPREEDFTVDLWFNCTATGGTQKRLCGQRLGATGATTEWFIERNTSNQIVAGIGIHDTLHTITSSSTFTDSTNAGWHHVALVRDDTTLRLFIDGVQVGTTAISGAVNAIAAGVGIGSAGEVFTNPWVGFVDEFRLSIGIARWTSAFAPPTMPYGLVAGTGVAGLTDEGATAATWTCVGDVQIDLDNYKLGTGAARFQGLGYLSAPDHADYSLGSGDFTIEAWFECEVPIQSGALAIAGHSANTFAGGDSSWILRREGAGSIRFYWEPNGGGALLSTSEIYTDLVNTGWHHVAVVRSGNTFSLYIDGKLLSTAVSATTATNSGQPLTIGARGTTDLYEGRIDAFRLSVGVARWTAEFVPPSREYTVPQSNSHILSMQTSSATRFALFRTPTDKFTIFGRNASNTTILDITTVDPLTPSQWQHITACIDLTDTAKRFIYINDVPVAFTVGTYTNDDIDFTTNDVTVATRASGLGTELFKGAIADLWFEDDYFDISVLANRRKFISTNNRPVPLGTTGELPTGGSPIIYLTISATDASDGFSDNEGTGGGFTLVGSTLSRLPVYYETSGFPAGVVIQLKDGTTITKQVDETDQSDTVTFTTPFPIPDDDILEAECLIVCGPFNSVQKRMYVMSVTPKNDMTASLVLVDEGGRDAYHFPLEDQISFDDHTSSLAYAPF